jgi:hypothetical protein
MTPRHLTPDAQAQALAEWGGSGSFRCVGCGKDCTDARPALAVPTSFPGLKLGACGPCAKQHGQSAGFRRQVAENARAAGFRSVFQRAADLIGVSGPALVEAMRPVSLRHDAGPEAFRLVDMALNVPAGSVEGALRSVLNLNAGAMQ